MEVVMRDGVIKKEYEKMVWVRDKEGKEYACYVTDIKKKEDLTEEEKAKCLDLNTVLGDSW
jgi:transposase